MKITKITAPGIVACAMLAASSANALPADDTSLTVSLESSHIAYDRLDGGDMPVIALAAKVGLSHAFNDRVSADIGLGPQIYIALNRNFASKRAHRSEPVLGGIAFYLRSDFAFVTDPVVSAFSVKLSDSVLAARSFSALTVIEISPGMVLKSKDKNLSAAIFADFTLYDSLPKIFELKKSLFRGISLQIAWDF